MKPWLAAVAVAWAPTIAYAQDDTKPPPTAKALGAPGESCRTSDDCNPELACIGGACGTRAIVSASTPPESPVARYRRMSVSLLSDAGAGFTFESDVNVAALAFGVSARLVVRGFLVGAQLTVAYEKQTSSNASLELGALEPGLTLGYVIPASDRVAVTPAVHVLSYVPFTPNSNVGSSMQLTGEVGVSIFLGHNGFLEPYLALGDYQQFSPGTAWFILSVGYRLGVVF